MMQEKKRIVIVGSYPQNSSLIKGGVEASTYGLSKSLLPYCDVCVIDFPRKGVADSFEEMDGVKVYRFEIKGSKNRDSVKSIPQIEKVFLAVKPQLCHIHGTGLFSLKIRQLSKKYDIPVVLTVHGLATVEAKNEFDKNKSIKALEKCLLKTYFERRVIKSCSDIIVDTGYVKDMMSRHRLMGKSEVMVIPQGVDNKYFSYSCRNDGPFTVLSVGALSERKSHLKLMEAFDLVWKKFPKIKLSIVGCKSEESYYQQMMKLKSSLSSGNNISIIPDASDSQLKDCYEEAFIFALHTQEESQGIVFAEAMACGLPIVATNVGGVPWVVKQGENGLLSQYGDISAFASNIETLFTDEVLRQRLSNNNKENANSFLWEEIAMKLSSIYECII